jgi:hypothetical protein
MRIIPALLLLAACRPVNTVPAPVSPTDPVQEFALDLPANLEIRHVDFSATTFSDVSGSESSVATSVGGRAFLQVYAVDRSTGESVLLLYENIARRKQPIQVIRFRAATARGSSARPGLPDR